jgi:hypothetical protein
MKAREPKPEIISTAMSITAFCDSASGQNSTPR